MTETNLSEADVLALRDILQQSEYFVQRGLQVHLAYDQSGDKGDTEAYRKLWHFTHDFQWHAQNIKYYVEKLVTGKHRETAVAIKFINGQHDIDRLIEIMQQSTHHSAQSWIKKIREQTSVINIQPEISSVSVETQPLDMRAELAKDSVL